MAKFAAYPLADAVPSASYQAPRRASGVVSSVALSPPDYSLWLCESELNDGATIEWDADHGDDAVYVLDGELDVEGRRCPSGGAVVVESGVSATVTARGRARLVHFGARDAAPPEVGLLGSPAPDGHLVHVVGPGGWFLSGKREGVHATWFADSTCPTCRAQLLLVAGGPSDDGKGKAHSHSQDEIIYLIEGSLRMGAHDFRARTSLCIPADMRYALVSGPQGHRFLNFRRDVSEQIYARDEPPILETALARGGVEVGDLR